MAAPEPCFFKRSLSDLVRNTNNFRDIIPLLQCIDMSIIQKFVNTQINQFDEATAKNAYYRSASIMQILPTDTIQYISSFNVSYHCLNKEWVQCSKNGNKRIKSMEQYEFNPIIEHSGNATNNVWVVHKDRTALTQTEREMMYQGPLQSIKEALKHCQSGDKLFIHDGKYKESKQLEIKKNIQLIGIGKDVLISTDFDITIEGNVYLENLCIETYPEVAVIDVCSSNLWIKNCSITSKESRHDIGIMVRSTSNLMVKNCKFWNCIMMAPKLCNVTAIGCIFKESMKYDNVESGGIEIYDNWRDVDKDSLNDETLKIFPFCSLKCIGNLFEKQLMHPLTVRDSHIIHAQFDEHLMDHIVLKHNLWKGVKVNELVFSVQGDWSRSKGIVNGVPIVQLTPPPHTMADSYVSKGYHACSRGIH